VHCEKAYKNRETDGDIWFASEVPLLALTAAYHTTSFPCVQNASRPF